MGVERRPEIEGAVADAGAGPAIAAVVECARKAVYEDESAVEQGGVAKATARRSIEALTVRETVPALGDSPRRGRASKAWRKTTGAGRAGTEAEAGMSNRPMAGRRQYQGGRRSSTSKGRSWAARSARMAQRPYPKKMGGRKWSWISRCRWMKGVA